jgi:hypothetical protein
VVVCEGGGDVAAAAAQAQNGARVARPRRRHAPGLHQAEHGGGARQAEVGARGGQRGGGSRKAALQQRGRLVGCRRRRRVGGRPLPLLPLAGLLMLRWLACHGLLLLRWLACHRLLLLRWLACHGLLLLRWLACHGLLLGLGGLRLPRLPRQQRQLVVHQQARGERVAQVRGGGGALPAVPVKDAQGQRRRAAGACLAGVAGGGRRRSQRQRQEGVLVARLPGGALPAAAGHYRHVGEARQRQRGVRIQPSRLGVLGSLPGAQRERRTLRSGGRMCRRGRRRRQRSVLAPLDLFRLRQNAVQQCGRGTSAVVHPADGLLAWRGGRRHAA